MTAGGYRTKASLYPGAGNKKPAVGDCQCQCRVVSQAGQYGLSLTMVMGARCHGEIGAITLAKSFTHGQRIAESITDFGKATPLVRSEYASRLSGQALSAQGVHIIDHRKIITLAKCVAGKTLVATVGSRLHNIKGTRVRWAAQ